MVVGVRGLMVEPESSHQVTASGIPNTSCTAGSIENKGLGADFKLVMLCFIIFS